MEKYTALFEKNNNQNQETISPFSYEKLENELINEVLRLHIEDFSNFQSPPQFEILISQHSQEAKKIINDLLLNNIDKWQNEFLKKHNNQFDSEISDYIDPEFDINPYVPLKQSDTEEEFSKQRTKELQYSINEDLVTSESLLPFRAFVDFKKEIIKAMGNTKDPDFIPSLINFAIKLGVNAPEYIEIITQSLKNINNPKSISLLLNLAQSTDSIERRIALSILYRLEDKQIGITHEGLLYLQKRFDLGEEYNKEKYFGQRITNAGQVGIFETSSNKLLKYFNIDIFSSDNLASKAKLLDITYLTLFTALPGETLEEKSQREKFLTHFQESYSDFFHNDFFKENNFHFNDLSFSEQAAFIRLYENYSKEDRHHLEVFSRTFGLSGFRSLLAMSADNDINTGKMVITISKQLSPQAAHQIFTEFNNLIEKTRITSSETFSQLQAEYPNSDIQEEQINYALLARGRDYFKEIYKQLSGNPEQTKAIIKEYSEELRAEKPAVSFFRSEFKTIAELLGRKNINLNSLSSEQSLLLQKISSDEYKEIAFRTLSRIGRLEPIPEIHWRVDRDPEEYNRRLGINVDSILENLQELSLNEKPKILLEIGPGSGKHKYNRSKKASGYEDYGLSDRIYYPLTPIIEKLLNFDSLEKDISQTLSDSDRKKLSDFIYKILVIQKTKLV